MLAPGKIFTNLAMHGLTSGSEASDTWSGQGDLQLLPLPVNGTPSTAMPWLYRALLKRVLFIVLAYRPLFKWGLSSIKAH